MLYFCKLTVNFVWQNAIQSYFCLRAKRQLAQLCGGSGNALFDYGGLGFAAACGAHAEFRGYGAFTPHTLAASSNAHKAASLIQINFYVEACKAPLCALCS